MLHNKVVANFISSLTIIDDHPVIYIEKNDVERAYILYNYMECTTKMLFSVSSISSLMEINDDKNFEKQLTRK